MQGRDVKSLEDLAAELLTTARQYTYTGRLEAKHHFFRYRGKVKLRASADVDQQDSADLWMDNLERCDIKVFSQKASSSTLLQILYRLHDIGVKGTAEKSLGYTEAKKAKPLRL